MANGKSIGEIYLEHQDKLPYAERFPFAVRKNGWGKSYYVVVEDLLYDGISKVMRSAKGVPVKNGELKRLFMLNAEWRNDLEIPLANSPIWHFVVGVDFSHYKSNGGQWSKIYELDSRLKWGKHRWLSVEELCQEHLDYVVWCIKEVEDRFCLSEQAVNSILEMGIALEE